MSEEHVDRQVSEVMSRAVPEMGAGWEREAVGAVEMSYGKRPTLVTRQRVRWATRMAFVAAAAALALGVFVVPSRWGQYHTNSIMGNVAQAMAEAGSVLFEYQRTPEGQQWYARLNGIEREKRRLSKHTMYLASHAFYEQRATSDGTVIFAQGIEPSKGEWWVYANAPGEKCVLYVVDLAPLQEKASDFLTKGVDFILTSGLWSEMLGNEDLADRKVTETTEHRDGQETRVLTFSGGQPIGYDRRVAKQLAKTHRDSSGFAIQSSVRNVLEIGMDTNYLLRMEEYRRLENEPEVLVATLNRIEYGQPAPQDMVVRPQADQTIKASAEFVEEEMNGMGLVALTMKVGEEEITHIAAPKDWRK